MRRCANGCDPPLWMAMIGIVLGVAMACVGFARADTNRIVAQAKESSKDTPKKPELVAVVSPEREAAVMTFVRRHHEELEALLIHLREARPKEYEKALRELFRVTERLGQIQDRDE